MNNDKPEFKYFFSVVTACYNVELYVEEAIKSILKQTIGFKEHIQLILVDDGSTDNTAKILDKYASKYPYNIFAVHKENGGVSSARNEGLKHIQGKYVNFMDADDKFSLDSFKFVYDFFEQHYEETDVVNVPTYYFDNRTGPHYLNSKFDLGSRVIDLNEDSICLVKAVNATFFKNEVLEDTLFDTNLAICEDQKFCSVILSKKLTLGACCEAIYYYRERSKGPQSAMQSSVANPSYYLPVAQHYYSWVSELKNSTGELNNYYQYLIINELQWRLSAQRTKKPDSLTDAEWEEYSNIVCSLANIIDDDKILTNDHLWLDYKILLMYKKHKKYPQLKYKEKDIALAYNDLEFFNISRQLTCVEILEIRDNKLHIEGFLRFIGLKEDKKVVIYLSTGFHGISCKTYDRNKENRYRFGFPIYRDIGFSVDVPLSIEYQKNIQIMCKIDNVKIERTKISFGKFSPIGLDYVNSYYFKDKWLVWFEKNRLHVRSCGKRGLFEREKAFISEMIKKKKYKYSLARVCYQLHYLPCELFKKNKKKERWLVFDRVNKGDDNGEAMFEYLQKNKKKEVKSEFLIKKNSPDCKHIKKIGKVIPILSRKHKYHYLLCDKIVTSNGDDFAVRPLLGVNEFRDICANKKYVFLQHGVTKDDVSDWLNKYNMYIDKLVTVTKPEYDSFLQPQYYYTKNNIILTGFPRYDRLYNDSKKYIAIMPTWRQYLNGFNDGGVWTARNDFEETDYFKFYNSLINDSCLLQAAKDYGYKIVFLPHPNVYQAYIQLFDRQDGVEFLPMNTQYRKVFAESDLLVTDYSSVAFDFAYLRKPVVYSQFDSETFFSGEHTYSKGYFDYDTMGFGEVCHNLQATVDALIDYIKSGCSLKEEYKQRIENTFPYNDKNNCQRVFEEIYDKRENK